MKGKITAGESNLAFLKSKATSPNKSDGLYSCTKRHTGVCSNWFVFGDSLKWLLKKLFIIQLWRYSLKLYTNLLTSSVKGVLILIHLKTKKEKPTFLLSDCDFAAIEKMSYIVKSVWTVISNMNISVPFGQQMSLTF